MKSGFDFFPWISPVSGKIRSEHSLPGLPEWYVWQGDRENTPQPSPVLIDIKLDIIDLRHAIDALLPKALPYGQLWRGNRFNVATPSQTIGFNNLPDLGISDNPLYVASPGKIWRGTNSGRPEESDALSALMVDVATLTTKVYAGDFLMGDAFAKLTWPNAQFLSSIEDGLLKHTGKILQQAVPGTDYVDADNSIPPIPAPPYTQGEIKAQTLPVWKLNHHKILTSTRVMITDGNQDGDDVQGINSLKAVLIQAKNAVTSDQDMISRNTMQTRQLILYDYDDAHRLTYNVSLKGPASINQNLTWIMPSAISQKGQVLTDISEEGDANRLLGFQSVVPLDAGFILKSPIEGLEKAQALSQLNIENSGMAKIVLTADGNGKELAIATPDEDYATKETLEKIKEETKELKDQTEQFKNQAQEAKTQAEEFAGQAEASAGEAAISAGEASVSVGAASLSAEVASNSAIVAAASAFAAGISASSAFVSASDAKDSAKSSAQSAESAAASLDKLLNTELKLTGDTTGHGLLNAEILTTFKPNPVFTGNCITLPSGTRPLEKTLGMIRITE